MQSQRNYGSFLLKSDLLGTILYTMLAQNCPKGKRQWAMVKLEQFAISRWSVLNRGNNCEMFEIKVVDLCRTCSTKCSDTFRSFFVCGKEQESRKKICHHRAKKVTFLRGFDCKNKVFGISRNLIDRFVFK